MAPDAQPTFAAFVHNVEDAFFVLAASTVFFMQAGFAFFEAGSVRSKNTTNILFKNLLDSFVGCVAFWAVGFAFAFGHGNGFIGKRHFFLSELDDGDLITFFIQYTYSITASTIVSGAMAERTELKSYLCFSAFCTSWLQPLVAHWTWTEEGWLYSGVDVECQNTTVIVRYTDFAGSSVVHVVGGVAAFTGALVLGPRIGRFNKDGNSVKLVGHTTTMATLGGFILAYGFFAFNLASHRSLSEPEDGAVMGQIAVNCILAGSGGSLTAVITQRCLDRRQSKWSLMAALNGCLTGMVAIGAGANSVQPYGGFIVGCIAGLVFIGVAKIVERVGVDDALDAVAVHFGGGVWGIMSIPFLDTEQGIFYLRNKVSLVLLGWNLCGLLVIIVWTASLSSLLFVIMNQFKILRVSPEVEIKGIDYFKHGGERAYSGVVMRKRLRRESTEGYASKQTSHNHDKDIPQDSPTNARHHPPTVVIIQRDKGHNFEPEIVEMKAEVGHVGQTSGAEIVTDTSHL